MSRRQQVRVAGSVMLWTPLSHTQRREDENKEEDRRRDKAWEKTEGRYKNIFPVQKATG